MYKSRVGLSASVTSYFTLAVRLGGLAPTLSLDFLSGSLDSRITFSRGSNATLVDSTGKVTYAPNNLLTYSEAFDNAAWLKNSGTVTPNSTVAPDGATTADTLEATAGVSGGPRLSQRPAVTGSTSYTISSYFKASGTNFAFISMRTAGSNWAGAEFNLSTGSVNRNAASGNVAYVGANITSAGNGWYRCSVTVTPTDTIAANVGYIFFGSSDGTSAFNGGFPVFINAGTESVYLWGAQLEQVTYQTTPSTYNATTASAYYGPRFDYDPVTLNPKGLLIEEQRTNLLAASEDFTAWSTYSVTVAANTTVAPDGQTSADTITASATSGYSARAAVFTGDGDKSYSLFIKAGTSAATRLTLRDTTVLVNRGSVDITWTAGVPSGVATTGTLQGIDSFGNGWYRVRMLATGVVAANANQFRFSPDPIAGTGTSIMWGAQTENGAFSTSYIPTVASTVTRSADVATMTGTNFSDWYNQSEGTFAAEFDTITLSAGATTVRSVVTAYDGTSSNKIEAYSYSNFVGGSVRTAGVTVADLNAGGSPANNIPIKIAIAYALNNVAVTANGATPGTDTSVSIPAVTQLGIGNAPSAANAICGHIRRITYYPTRLANATLQRLTA